MKKNKKRERDPWNKTNLLSLHPNWGLKVTRRPIHLSWEGASNTTSTAPRRLQTALLLGGPQGAPTCCAGGTGQTLQKRPKRSGTWHFPREEKEKKKTTLPLAPGNMIIFLVRFLNSIQPGRQMPPAHQFTLCFLLLPEHGGIFFACFWLKILM